MVKLKYSIAARFLHMNYQSCIELFLWFTVLMLTELIPTTIYSKFYEQDLTYSYPYVTPTVSQYECACLAILLPIPFICYCIYYGAIKTHNSSKILSVTHVLLHFCYAIVVNSCINQIVKVVVNEPRPNAYAQCNYAGYRDFQDENNLAAFYASGVTAYGMEGSYSKCLETDEDIRYDAFLSFPSGHASMIYCSMVYLIHVFQFYYQSHCCGGYGYRKDVGTDSGTTLENQEYSGNFNPKWNENGNSECSNNSISSQNSFNCKDQLAEDEENLLGGGDGRDGQSALHNTAHNTSSIYHFSRPSLNYKVFSRKFQYGVLVGTRVCSILALCLASYVSITRVLDHYHHMWDIICGGVLGAAVATIVWNTYTLPKLFEFHMVQYTQYNSDPCGYSTYIIPGGNTIHNHRDSMLHKDIHSSYKMRHGHNEAHARGASQRLAYFYPKPTLHYTADVGVSSWNAGVSMGALLGLDGKGWEDDGEGGMSLRHSLVDAMGDFDDCYDSEDSDCPIEEFDDVATGRGYVHNTHVRGGKGLISRGHVQTKAAADQKGLDGSANRDSFYYDGLNEEANKEVKYDYQQYLTRYKSPQSRDGIDCNNPTDGAYKINTQHTTNGDNRPVHDLNSNLDRNSNTHSIPFRSSNGTVNSVFDPKL